MMTRQSRLQDRAQTDPFFVGHRLAQYRKNHILNLRELAEFLSCTPADVERLSLCRAPDSSEPEYAAMVKRVAEYAACDASRLIQILRSSEAVHVLRQQRLPHSPNTLLAARDRKQTDDEEATELTESDE